MTGYTALGILLAHLVGDYILQSHWMSQEKTKRWWPALLHAVTYGLPYLAVTRNPWALLIIVGTHAVIDRYRLARHVVWTKNHLAPWRNVNVPVIVADQVKEFRCEGTPAWSECKATGYPPDTPPWLAVWLMIIADNTIHLVINTGAILAFGTRF